MRNAFFTFVTVALGTSAASTAHAATQYARLKCGVENANGKAADPSFDGYLILNDADIQQSPGHLLVRGQPVDLDGVAVKSPACTKAFYQRSDTGYNCDDDGENCDWPMLRYDRDWNAFNVTARDSTVLLDCAANSVLETYSSKAALFAGLARQYVLAKNWDEGQVNSTQCLVDKLPQ